jgi:general secretion pathway protein G
MAFALIALVLLLGMAMGWFARLSIGEGRRHFGSEAAWNESQKFADAQSRLHVANTEASMQLVAVAINLFNMKHGRYPARLAELSEMPKDIDSKDWPEGGYFGRIPKDDWSRDFVYRYPGKGESPFDLVCLGMDGREGGAGFDADFAFKVPTPK